MSFLTFDEKQAEGFTLPPAGEYEVYVKNAKSTTSSVKGTPGVELLLVIRKDIGQEGKGQNIYDTLWVSEKAMFRFHQINKAIGVPHGTVFETQEEQIQALVAQPIRVKVKVDEYTNSQGQDRKRLVVEQFLESQSKNGFQAPVEEETGDNSDPFSNNGPLDLSDDDLPF